MLQITCMVLTEKYREIVTWFGSFYGWNDAKISLYNLHCYKSSLDNLILVNVRISFLFISEWGLVTLMRQQPESSLMWLCLLARKLIDGTPCIDCQDPIMHLFWQTIICNQKKKKKRSGQPIRSIGPCKLFCRWHWLADNYGSIIHIRNH